MKWLGLSLLVAALVLPAAAVAGARGAGDGTLVVRDANAKVDVTKARGTIFGHLDKGWLTVTDYNPDDSRAPEVNGWETSYPSTLTGTTWVYKGADIRFRFFGGRYSITVYGSGIDISAVGKGTVTVRGLTSVVDGNYGTFAVDGQKFVPIQLLPTVDTFGTPASP
jgi:hypothetical protein